MHQLWNGIAQNFNNDIWQKHSKDSRTEFANFACFNFHVGLLFINFSSFKPDTENNANFDAISLSSKHANFNETQFLKHIDKLIIFSTHNLQTFQHNTLINELLLMQFYLINIRPKLHHQKWQKLLPVNMLTVPNFLNFTSSLLTLFFVQPLFGIDWLIDCAVFYVPSNTV